MLSIIDRINKRLRTIKESPMDASWKDPHSSKYDRQKAEDALFHTIGPLTDTPTWVDKAWSSPGEPVSGFQPGGQAPQWTQDEIVWAYAGDPSLILTGTKNNPHSPEYGNKGGAPLYRLARKVARFYSRHNDSNIIADLYHHGFIPLVQAMQPGFDESREPFISWVAKNVESAMVHGIGGEKRTNLAAGGDSQETGLRGVQSLVKETDPEAIRLAANDVQGKYQNTRSHDKHPDNPFGPFSSKYYQIAMMYADALEAENPEGIEAAQNQLRQLGDEIKDDYSRPIRGASTGLGQAISTPDRAIDRGKAANKRMRNMKVDSTITINNIKILKLDDNTVEVTHPELPARTMSITDATSGFAGKGVGVVSMDIAGSGGDETRTMAGNMVGDDPRTDKFGQSHSSMIDPETLEYVLDIAINHDLRDVLKNTKYEILGLGGKMQALELRYVIRGLGPLGTNYPGKGYMRESIDIPREARGWWHPGEDPEIEPIPDGGKWTSIWLREGGLFKSPSAIAAEMTEEVREFNQLGIATQREIKQKIKKGRKYEETVSSASIIPAQKKARMKLLAIAEIHADSLGIDDPGRVFGESIRRSGIVSESLDRTDRMLIAEAAREMAHILTWGLVQELAPKYNKVVR